MHFRRSSASLLVLVIVGVLLGNSGAAAQGSFPYAMYLPLIQKPQTPQLFGVDLSSWYTSPESLQLVHDMAPVWVRTAGVNWGDVESTPGQYDWGMLYSFEQMVKKVRDQGIEPVVIVNTPPPWARKYPDLKCSPPAPEHIGSFTRFLQALSARYQSGPFAVHYWELGNEPDGTRPPSEQNNGMDCWGEATSRYRGGDYYGQVLVQAAAALRSGNSNARVLGGALLYWLDSDFSDRFLEGMIVSGGVDAADYVSFHAYGEWETKDMLIKKTDLVRAQLAKYGRAHKPLFATEVAATCAVPYNPSCDQSSDFITNGQPNYAARIAAETIALNLQGALWYTLVSEQPGFNYSQLVDFNQSAVAPRRAYYALRNSTRLLAGATYTGPPVTDPTNDPIGQVRILPFQKENITMYVLWVQRTDCSNCQIYNLPVPPGALARCTTNLDGRTVDNSGETGKPYFFNCSDKNNDGSIPITVNEQPQYIEVLDQGASIANFLTAEP